MSQYQTLISDHSKTKKSQINTKNDQGINQITSKISKDIKKDLDHYQILKEIGKGTFASVYKARHILTDQFVAIKILDKRKVQDEKDWERIRMEIEIMKQLRHPNIIQLYEIYEDQKKLYLVLEYAEKGELFERIVKQKRLQQNEARKFFLQLLNGVEYIHKLKISHWDLKPENLLLDQDLNIKIIDFGLSNFYSENDLMKTACGSPCYASPEMIKGWKYNGLCSDIWSLGIVLYTMICGCLPFDDPNTQNLYWKIIKGEYHIPSYISNEATQLIKGILQTNPQTRLNIEQIKNHIWLEEFYDKKNWSKGIIIGTHQIPICNQALKKIKKIGFDSQKLKEDLMKNKHNKMTTFYYLILKQMLRENSPSQNDIQNPQFEYSQIMVKNIKAKSKEIPQEKSKSKIQTQIKSIPTKIKITSKDSIINRIKKSMDVQWKIPLNLPKKSQIVNTRSNQSSLEKVREIFDWKNRDQASVIQKPILIKNTTENQHRQKLELFLKSSIDNLEIKQKKASIMVDQNQQIKMKLDIIYKDKQEEKIIFHEGPIQLSLLTTKTEQKLIQEIENFLQQNEIKITQKQQYKIQANSKGFEFLIEIKKIKNQTHFNYVYLQKTSGNDQDFHQFEKAFSQKNFN